ncbi:hypothetical protein KAZ57_00690, partial [Patescibacteria group bacterium]|nr:hypothetical protein [Patescibacteria group bacterium]
IRHGNIKDINVTSEGNFSVSSGVVGDDDVVILSTKYFADVYTPQKLLQSAISAKELQNTQACLIMKFVVDTNFTEDEIINFNPKSVQAKTAMENILGKTKKLGSLTGFFKNKAALNKPDAPEPQAITSLGTSIKIKKRLTPRINFRSKTVLLIVGGVLLISLIVSYLKSQNADNQEKNETAERHQEVAGEQAKKEPEEQKPAAEDTANDQQNKVQRVATEILYDLKLADQNSKPFDVLATKSKLFISDKDNGKLFVSDIAAPKFSAVQPGFMGIGNVTLQEGGIGFADASGYKILDVENNSVSSSFTGSFGINDAYNGNIYSLDNNKITKHTKTGDNLESSTWGESTDFLNAKSLSVAYSIYIVTADSKLVAYTQGDKSTFEVTGLDTGFKEASKVVASVDFDNIYVADRGNGRIVILSGDGAFIKQLRPAQGFWDDLVSISISPDESKIFLVNGSKVYSASL